jgi:hypothetical protein
MNKDVTCAFNLHPIQIRQRAALIPLSHAWQRLGVRVGTAVYTPLNSYD